MTNQTTGAPASPVRATSALHTFGDISRLLVLNTDSYKTSHYLQYPPGTTKVFSYIESRGGVHDRTLFFGLQYILKEYFSKPVTALDVELADEVCRAHGVPFNRKGWMHIVNVHQGRLPVRICAVPEGSVVPNLNVLVTIENTDPACFWLTSFLETVLMRVWYPVTVATNTWMCKQLILKYLRETGDESGIGFKLHDFGARGVSSMESAMLGGMAHLVNFQGTDTLSAVLGARVFYGEHMAGFSIPAAEHSTITSWGKEGEADAYSNMLVRYAKPGALLAVVSDSYDLNHAVKKIWGEELRQQVIDSGATVVIRPDSGDPAAMVLNTVKALDASFGCVVNAKGFRVLQHVRVIQGDGITVRSIRTILSNLQLNGYSTDNVAFGQGGALLQIVNRDDQRFAMKCSAVEVNGELRDVFKDPVTDPHKRSKAGRLVLMKKDADYLTVSIGGASQQSAAAQGYVSAMQVVFENGELKIDDSLQCIRDRANAAAVDYRLGYFSASAA
jgi:nicotinamide phosphoribosyltransferase